MSMKILIDCVLTATPSKCSTAIVFKTSVERLLESKPDVFFYWLVPVWLTDGERDWFPKSDRIKYLDVEQSKDRVREYLTLPSALYEACTFYGPCWDFDVLFTMRAGLVPQMRLLMNGPRDIKKWWVKEVWLLDVMPAINFKKTVPQMAPVIHDRWTLAGYQAADKVWMISYYEPKGALREARRLLQPSQANAVANKLESVITAQSDAFMLKPEDKQYTSTGERPFGLAFIGRMEKANGIEDIADILEKAWVLRGDNVKQLVCTVSKVIKTFDEDVVDIRFPPREEFWDIVQNEMDAFVYMGKSGATSLSVLEPLMLGTPVITVRDEAKVALLGEDYPFYATGPATIYGVFKALYDDYPNQYKKFADWHVQHFQPMWKERFSNDLMYPKILQAAQDYEAKMEAATADLTTLSVNQTVVAIADNWKSGETIYETVIRTGWDVFGVMTKKANPEDHKVRNLTFMSSWNMYRIGLKLYHGFEDASTKLGHIKKKESTPQ